MTRDEYLERKHNQIWRVFDQHCTRPHGADFEVCPCWRCVVAVAFEARLRPEFYGEPYPFAEEVNL
jgi:hypothetical protein